MRDPDSSWGMRVSRHLGRILCGKYQGTLLITYDLISKWCLIHPASTCSYHGILSNFNGKENPSSPSTWWMRFNFRPPLRPTPPKAWLSHRCRCENSPRVGSVLFRPFSSQNQTHFFWGRKPGFHKTPRSLLPLKNHDWKTICLSFFGIVYVLRAEC